MKKTVLLLFFVLLAAGLVSAQDNYNFRGKYINLGYSTQKLTFEGLPIVDLASKYGAGISIGRSFVLHKKPLGGMVRLGIDATWFDLNYGNWRERPLNTDEDEWVHKIDIALGVGPAIHINPVSQLGIHAYFRFNPTGSIILDNLITGDLEGHAGYASYFTTGGAVSWRFISVGVEARFGKGNYYSFKGEDNEELGHTELIQGRQKIKTKGLRAYISFRF